MSVWPKYRIETNNNYFSELCRQDYDYTKVWIYKTIFIVGEHIESGIIPLQILIRNLFFKMQDHHSLYAPYNLGGALVKKQLFRLVSKK